jgi:hypothetical protein
MISDSMLLKRQDKARKTAGRVKYHWIWLNKEIETKQDGIGSKTQSGTGRKSAYSAKQKGPDRAELLDRDGSKQTRQKQTGQY